MAQVEALPAARASWQAAYARDGYVAVRGLLAPAEVEELCTTFMALHAAGPIPHCFAPVPLAESGGDVLKAYPRMMQPHRVNATARRYLLHPRIWEVLEACLGEEPLAAQSMFYFKPPTARGQALHQDDYYLRTKPGRCIAAWVAVDPSDEENGGLVVVPGTQDLPLLCPHEADPRVSFTRDEVDLPPGLVPRSIPLAPGDVLFFHGTLVHGSFPNRSRDRFRRAFICHYVPASTERMSRWYNPLLTRAGEERTLPDNGWGGPCGEEHDL
jgi:ectoine hydroxylase-related dioxygenase (phytanoyl-CoA dioxygenase family)